MAKPLLPSLKSNSSIAPPTVGEWHKYDGDLIQRLSRDIDVGFNIKDNKDKGKRPVFLDISSIPDLWAHPILFETALYDTDHILHDRVTQEWRGLLAMIALKEIRLISELTVRDIVLDNTHDNESKFLKIAHSLLPKKTICGDTKWDKLHGFLFGSEIIGFTSPATLVCTAPDTFNKIRNVAWFKGRYLVDPIPYLNQTEKLQLASWLEEVRYRIIEHTKMNGEIDPDMLRNLLKTIGNVEQRNGFIGDLLEGMEDYSISNITFSQLGLGLSFGFFSKLNYPIVFDNEGALYASNVRLIPTAKPEPAESILVIDKNMWGKEDSEIVVYGSANLSSVKSFSGIGSSKNFIGNLSLPTDVKIWKRTDFFTKKLYVIDQPEALPGILKINKGQPITYNQQQVVPIIPINEKLLEYLRVQDINDKIRFISDKSGITVSITIPLSGISKSVENYEIKHTYLINNENGASDIIILNNAPLLTVWPNLIKQENKNPWKNYYTYCRRTGTSSFYCKPAKSVVKTRENTVSENGSEIQYELFRTDTFPEAMTCFTQSWEDEVPEYTGIIFIKKPNPTLSRDSEWIVGVDFGTAGTTVYYREDDGESKNIKFREDRMLKVTNVGVQTNFLFDEFLPPKDMDTPFLSIFHHLNTSKLDNLSPMMDGHIYFLKDFNTFKANNPGIQTNLKWGGTKQRIFTEAFLKQLCLQCAVEAVSAGAERIQWRYSYPTAFTRIETDEYVSQWDALADFCNEISGLKEIESDKITLSMSESLAAARYFYDKNAATLSKGYVCIDIGGGTTDISIWRSRDNKSSHRLQTSIKFAGRDIILSLIKKKPRFLKIFGIDEKFINKLKELKGNESAFYSQAEALITNKWDDILKMLPKKSAEQELKDFLNIVAFAMGGLIYYVATLIKYLIIQDKDFINRGIPNIYIGGNGSKILHWLSKRPFDKKTPINELFKNIVMDVCECRDTNFEINASEEPKSEAAKGLICSDRFKDGKKDGDSDIPSVVISGENFVNKTSGIEKRCFEIIEESDIKDGIYISRELPQIKNFISIFNRYAHDSGLVEIGFEEGNFMDVTNEIDDQLDSINGNNLKDVHVYPLFIMEIKKVLEMKSNEWASK